MSSPVVLGLIACVLVLVAMIAGLWAIINATAATRAFNQAVQDYDDGDYRTAIRVFDGFVEKNPQDLRVGKVRVLRAMANVRHMFRSRGDLDIALEASQQALDDVGSLEEFRDVRPDLGELLIRIGVGLADRARTTADPKGLAEAEAAVTLHAQVAGEPASRFSTDLACPASCRRLEQPYARPGYARGPGGHGQALAEGSATRVYDTRDALVGQYADLTHDKELIARMTAANELIRRAVSSIPNADPRPALAAPGPARSRDQPDLAVEPDGFAGQPHAGGDCLRTGRRFCLRDRRQIGACPCGRSRSVWPRRLCRVALRARRRPGV